MLKLFFLIVGSLLQAGCPENASSELEAYKLPYDLTQPDKTLELDLNLNEISGLSFAFGESRLVAVNDEQGVVYLLDPETGSQIMSLEFHSPGDYEGVEVVGDHAYVVKSTGTIYALRNFATEGMEMTKYNDFLEKENDVEGLGYDAKSNQLLVACKGKAGDGPEFAAKRAIYAFDLETNTFDTLPKYLISLEDVRKYLDQNTTLQAWEQLSEFFDPAAEDLTFAPSALAIHPISGDIYLLSSVGKLLLVLNQEGQIVYLEKLKKSVHRQPEGICFAADGTLYISNEAKGTVPLIHRFAYKSN
ncbi:MAG: SdiA-regulated domain-containing protein [Saprospiraceae bacterium]|nr:SdiA-regulated domain-containing protein [Saprospiraceae bacterium]